MCGALPAITLALSAAFAGAIPAAGANRTFLFASPATREPISDEDSRIRLTSFEQINATAVADRAACTLTQSVEIANTLGIYDKSSENSFIVESDLDRNNSEDLADLMGLYLRQKFILLFFEEAGGGDKTWIIKSPQSWTKVTAALRKWKLTPVTVHPEKDRSEIWFVDMGDKRAADLKLFTSDVSGQASIVAGVAELTGDPDRGTAVKLWRQQILSVEQSNGQHLSTQFSSNGWLGATKIHTCSTELSNP